MAMNKEGFRLPCNQGSGNQIRVCYDSLTKMNKDHKLKTKPQGVKSNKIFCLFVCVLR